MSGALRIGVAAIQISQPIASPVLSYLRLGGLRCEWRVWAGLRAGAVSRAWVALLVTLGCLALLGTRSRFLELTLEDPCAIL